MRGRKPSVFNVEPAELAELKRLARDEDAPYKAVVGARILLARVAGHRICEIAKDHGKVPSTVFRICRHFKSRGFEFLLLPRGVKPRQCYRRTAIPNPVMPESTGWSRNFVHGPAQPRGY